MKLGVSEIFKKISEEKNATTRKELLWQEKDNPGVIAMLRMAYDPNIKFNLPEGSPPYKPCEYLDQQSMFYNSIRKLYLFINEGNPGVTQVKREMLFINMLESLDPEDAKLLLAVKEKKMPYKGITKKLVLETFPGLLPNE